jgi:hypothetical protein
MKDKNELKELKRKLTILNNERIVHMRSLTHGKPLIHGLPYKVFRKCGKSNCKCAVGEKHGPYPALAVNKNGRQRTVMVKKKDVLVVEQKAERYRRFQQTLARIRRINKEIDKLLEQVKVESIETYP